MPKDIVNTVLGFPSELVNQVGNVFSTNTIKIAITGLSRSGKTVFISSLIDQLLYQNRLVSVTTSHAPFKVRLKPPLHNMRRFDYYTFVDKLKNEQVWPGGTDTISHTLLEFESKSRFSFMGNSTFTVELIDYPGEWLLDLTMLDMSFETWSKKTLSWLEGLNEPNVKAYLKSVASLTSTSSGTVYETALHEAYKKLAMDLKVNHYSQITPGRFIMPSDLANDPMLVFAPINEASPELIKVFKIRYDRYVNEVVKGIHLEHFRGFERQVVLVDVIESLQNGYACHQDMKSGMQRMLALYDHNNKNFITQWLSPSIKKVLFVATKADQVAASQHANFKELLEEMVGELRHELDISHIETSTQIVSSLKSTTTIEKKYNGRQLSFVRGILEEDGALHDLYPGEMPSSFPSKESWESDNYAYKRFLPPKQSYGASEALEHINMDKVVEKLLGDLL